jgi:hypothetical protein
MDIQQSTSQSHIAVSFGSECLNGSCVNTVSEQTLTQRWGGWILPTPSKVNLLIRIRFKKPSGDLAELLPRNSSLDLVVECPLGVGMYVMERFLNFSKEEVEYYAVFLYQRSNGNTQ